MKDGSKADVTLNIYARRLAIRYLEDNDECFVYLSSCIGKSELPSATVKIIKDGVITSTTIEFNKTPFELVEELDLNKPIYAKLMSQGYRIITYMIFELQHILGLCLKPQPAHI